MTTSHLMTAAEAILQHCAYQMNHKNRMMSNYTNKKNNVNTMAC